MLSDRKVFVLDTSVLIHDPTAIHNFHEHDVIIPYVVVHELDGLRGAPNGRGTAARQVIRDIEEIRSSCPSLCAAPLGDGLGSISIEHPSHMTTSLGNASSSERDELVIACARGAVDDNPDRKVAIVSKDIGLRIRASILGIAAEDYRRSRVTTPYTGLHDGIIQMDLPRGHDLHREEVAANDDLIENEFAYITFNGHESVDPVLCRRKDGRLRPVGYFQKGIYGIRPMDDYQRMALDVLTDEDVTCVALLGVAGAGKTLLALAVGLQGILGGEYESLMTIKPIVPVGGRDIGYLKGDKFDKLFNWQRPILDNLRIIQMYAGKSANIPDATTLAEEGIWQPEALTFMRGRTLHGYWVIADETQNTNPHELKTALSRIGEKTKVVMLADTSQIDNPYVDAESCGATIVVEKLKGSPLFAVVPSSNSHRSEFAQLMTDRMAPTRDGDDGPI